MNIVFMGTPDFAAKSLECIVDKHNVMCVITQPDRPKGRGQKMQFTPVKEVAIKNNIEVLQPNRIKEESDVIEKIKSLNPDIMVVVAYGQVLSKEILDIPKYGCINVHASILPRLRGAAPISWAIINGDETTGVTIMQMNEGLDTGDMLLKRETPIYEKETEGELRNRLMDIGGSLLVEALEKIEANELKGEKQDDSLSTYASMMKKDLGRINWDKDAKNIFNLIRGVIPWPGAFTFYNDTQLKIWQSEYVSGDFKGENGQILKCDKKGILVKANNGAILITEIQKLGGKRLDIASFLNGNALQCGEKLN